MNKKIKVHGLNSEEEYETAYSYCPQKGTVCIGYILGMMTLLFMSFAALAEVSYSPFGFGYKNHTTVDNKHKLIRNYDVTSAEVHDSQVFIEILAENTSRDVWADSAYQSEEHEIALDV